LHINIYFLKNSSDKTLANFVIQQLKEKSTVMNELSAADSIAGHVAFSFADLQVIAQSTFHKTVYIKPIRTIYGSDLRINIKPNHTDIFSTIFFLFGCSCVSAFRQTYYRL